MVSTPAFSSGASGLLAFFFSSRVTGPGRSCSRSCAGRCSASAYLAKHGNRSHLIRAANIAQGHLRTGGTSCEPRFYTGGG